MAGEHDQVRLPDGTIRYRDVGSGPPLVFVHGLFVNGAHWRRVVPELSDSFRCIAPDLPLGAHRIAMDADADLSPPGVTRLLVDLLDALDVDHATFVGNDTGGAFCQLLVARHLDRVDRLVLTNCDAFENFLPPRYRYLQYAARLPGSVFLLAQCLRSRVIRRSPIAFGPLTTRGIPDDVSERYVEPLLDDPGVRRDVRAVLVGISPGYTTRAADAFADFERPVLLAWAPEDTVAFPVGDARRLLDRFPNAELVEIPDSYAFVPEDQPGPLADEIRSFLGR